MYADNQFMQALANKLIEISEGCVDMDTKEELDNLIEVTLDSIK